MTPPKRALAAVVAALLSLARALHAQPAVESGATGAAAPPAVAPEQRFAALPPVVRPGDPVTVAGTGGGETVFLIDPRGRRLAKAFFFDAGDAGAAAGDAGGPDGLQAAVFGVPSTAAPGDFVVSVETVAGLTVDLPLTVAPRDFVAETIPLDEKNTALRVETDPVKTAESERLWAILTHTGTEIYAAGPFTPPVASTRRTSFFGDRRVYRYVDGAEETAIHAGVDYGVPTGTEVRACAAGRVVLARPRVVTGNSVVIEHLPGVYSLYYHLDAIRVGENALVDAGDLVGLSGSTGLATGPHLHWELRAAGENVDPDAFVARAVLDRAAMRAALARAPEAR